LFAPLLGQGHRIAAWFAYVDAFHYYTYPAFSEALKPAGFIGAMAIDFFDSRIMPVPNRLRGLVPLGMQGPHVSRKPDVRTQ
jgi:hypothetical protein